MSQDNANSALLPFDEACDRIFGLIQPLAATCVPTENADGLVLADPAVAQRTSPCFALSAMDGYAVRAIDVAPGKPLHVRAHLAAGADANAHALHLRPGECARIFTGAALPHGADAILIQENTRIEPSNPEHVIPTETVPSDRFVRQAGLDFHKHDVLADKGSMLTPASLALFISGGLPTLSVIPTPRIRLISTGDELVSVSKWQPHQASSLPASNGPMLKALLARHGFDASLEPITPDRLTALEAQIDGLLTDTDLIISTGGASVGDHDIVRQYLETRADDVFVQKIAMRPGKPVMLARLGSTWWLALPGNPVSSFVTGFIFGIGIARRLAGNMGSWPNRRKGTLGSPLGPNDKRLEFMRAVETDGVLKPFGKQDSSMIKNLAQANALLIRPAHAPEANVGDAVSFVGL